MKAVPTQAKIENQSSLRNFAVELDQKENVSPNMQGVWPTHLRHNLEKKENFFIFLSCIEFSCTKNYILVYPFCAV
jgi:hypothetical protein